MGERSLESVSIRPFELADLATLWEMAGDEDFQRYLGAPRSIERLERTLEEEMAFFASEGWGLFAIVSTDQALLGYTGFVPSIADGRPELVCAVRKDYRSSGVATRACQAAIEWAFSTQQWPQICAAIADGNMRAMGLVAG